LKHGEFRRCPMSVVFVCLFLLVEVPCTLGQAAAKAPLSPKPVVANPAKANSATLPTDTPPFAPATQVALVKDVSSVQGIRDNQLIGYGIVVGLQNSGDSQMTYFPLQTLLSTLQRLG